MDTHVDRDAGTVVVRLIAMRTDQTAYRHGQQVRTEVIGDRFECAVAYAF